MTSKMTMAPQSHDGLEAFARALERHATETSRATRDDEIARRSLHELLAKTRSLKPHGASATPQRCDLYALALVHLTRVAFTREFSASALEACAALAIDAVLTAFHALDPTQSPSLESTAAASSAARGAGLVDPFVFLSAFRRVLSASPTPTVWTDLGVSIAVCSLVLQRQRSTSSSTALSIHEIQELLDVCISVASDTNNGRDARAAYLLQALLVAIERREEDRATALLRQGVAAEQEDASAASAGPLRFWYAVLLGRTGRHHAARAQLQLAVRDDFFSPTLAFQLSALLALRDDDVDGATGGPPAVPRALD
ncbi:hypothetical protein PINS_up010783 [Pythium insidiosum]|nr:hypothetical protein PINS_up010783 [Pythium insidiosum]